MWSVEIGDFEDSVKLSLDELLQMRFKEKKVLDAKILNAKLAQQEAERIERERLAIATKERRAKTIKIASIIATVLVDGALGLYLLVNYLQVFLFVIVAVGVLYYLIK